MQNCPLTWELDSLFPHPETDEFRAAVDASKAALGKLAERSDSLADVGADSAASWGAFLGGYGDAVSELNSMSAFVSCHGSADAANKAFMKYEGELASFGPLVAKICTNVEFGLQAASDEDFEAFLAADSWLSENAFFVRQARKDASLRLPRELELLASELDVDGIHAWGRLYDRVSSAVRVEVMEKGEVVKKSPGQVSFDSPLRSVRENKLCAFSKAWDEVADTCADALNHICGTRLTKYERLGIDHLAVPLNMNRMTRETLDTMWSVVSERKNCLAEYLSAKAKLMGLEKLAMFDMDAPLPSAGSTGGQVSYDEACSRTVAAASSFSPDFGEFAEMSIRERWIEVEDRGGKRQGGFCTDIGTHKQSRIFMTFTGTVDGMSTLAHEIGHAYHTWVLRDQPIFLRHYPMNLAETASTFAEAVLGESQLAACGSDDEKRSLLDKMLSDSVAFLMNIHARFLFEDRFHRERPSGEISAEQLSEFMLAAQKEAYLGVLDDDGWYPGAWISKLHYYITEWPFYNFPYTFGYLLSLGTYSLAKDSPDFPQQFKDFLLATGNMTSEDAVQQSFGFDLREPDFWNRSIDVVEDRVKQFLELC
jgi:pepF/M3 family oligoendopeptidase